MKALRFFAATSLILAGFVAMQGPTSATAAGIKPTYACQGGVAYSITWNNLTAQFQDNNTNVVATAVYNMRYWYQYDNQCGEYPVEVDVQQVSGSIYTTNQLGADFSVQASTGNPFDGAGHDCGALPHASSGQWKVSYFQGNRYPSSPIQLFSFFNSNSACTGYIAYSGSPSKIS